MRLDKYISHALKLTRNDARQIIKSKVVKINDIVVTKNDYQLDIDKDIVKYFDKELIYQKFIYLMMNKPQGIISANTDNFHKTVIDLVRNDYPNYDLNPVGRLDIDTEGLLILTNDGKMLHQLTSPNKDTYKKYYVEVDGTFFEEEILAFKEGFELFDGNGKKYRIKPAILDIINPNTAYISISEGKYHQIKKMCLKFNKTVTYLKRVSVGKLILDESLKPGEYKELTTEEISLLKI